MAARSSVASFSSPSPSPPSSSSPSPPSSSASSPSTLPSPGAYIQQLIHEAKRRWLKPAEICEILNNHDKLQISETPPDRPGSGLLFLFDRNKLRYFRKDGHKWRKKKDGKTIKEAHEKLKDGNKDVIHCYYAHGEEDPNFQRRSYWLLDAGYDHIVLVHYRQVTEGNTPTLVKFQPQHIKNDNVSEALAPNILLSLSDDTCQSYTPSEDDGILRVSGFGTPRSRGQFQSPYEKQSCSNITQERVNSSLSPKIFDPIPKEEKYLDQIGFPNHGRGAKNDEITPGAFDNNASACRGEDNVGTWQYSSFEQPVIVFDANEQVPKENSLQSEVLAAELQEANMSEIVAFNEEEVQKLKPSLSDLLRSIQFDAADRIDPSGILRNISFGSEPCWEIDKGIPMDSGSSNLSGQIQVTSVPDQSVLQNHFYSIEDFAPSWSYAFEEAKIIVTGSFVNDIDISNTRLCCMFGEVEVPAEILRSGALRCTAPALKSGTVSFYVTCNQIPCSEILEFKYRGKPVHDTSKSEQAKKESDQRQELLLQIRLCKMLCIGEDQEEKQEKNDQWNALFVDRSAWTQIEDTSTLLQMLLKYIFQQWFCGKDVKDVKNVSLLDNHGLGILHMLAALGYDWAIAPVLSTGIPVDFRDIHGWTALHWAAFCGREKVIAALLAAGASPGSLTDPTPSDATGRIAADLAAISGHKGIAGYLAEASLTSHLTSLKLNTVNGHEVVEVVSEKSIVHRSSGMTEDELSLKDSLAAVRNAAQAATRIQSAFRAYSFHNRNVKSLSLNEFGISEQEARAFAVGQGSQPMLGRYHEKLNNAATRIQCKYRGWKGRKDFISLRKHVVKIQALVRGHQVRKHKQLLSAVGVMEKAILRWRRKGTGLRGYKAEYNARYDDNDETLLKDFRKQKEAGFVDSLSLVKEMVRNPEARTQYRRMLELYRECEVKGGALIDSDFMFDDDLLSLLVESEFSST